jgi:hypothetical protein
MIFLYVNFFLFFFILAYIFFFPFVLLDIFLLSIIFYIIFFITRKKELIKIIIPLIFFMLFSLSIANIFVQSERYFNYCSRLINSNACFVLFNKVEELKIKRKIKNDKFPNEIFIE